MNLTFRIVYKGDLLDSRKAGQGMAEGVRDSIRRHFTERNLHTSAPRHGLPHSGYWHKAAGSVRVESQHGLSAVVSAGADSANPNEPGQGVALHYYGGVVYPAAGHKALAIPISPQVAGRNPREVNALTDGIALVWPKNSSHGFLKDEETNELLWLLVPKATIKADRTVLPSDEALMAAAEEGIMGAMAS